ncbi:TPA: LPXTG cell wall anchor domain-containing protein [Streptococcus suis]
MKKNLIKSLTLSTATLAAFSMANTVLAEEVLTSNTTEPASQATSKSSTQELANQVAQAENTVTSTQTQLEQAQQALAEQEKNLNKAQIQLESTQTVADSTAENLTKAEETAAQATPENISTAQGNINTAIENVAQASAQVDITTATQNQAQASYNQQAELVAEAQSNLESKTATYDTTLQLIKTKEEEQNQAVAQLNQDLSTSQSEVTTLENTVSIYSNQLESAKTELNALKNSVNVDELYQLQLDKFGELTTAKNELKSAQEQLDKLQNRSELLQNSQSPVTLTIQNPTIVEEKQKHPDMSATIYSGERTETVYLTAEQAKEYAEKGTISYVPNSTKITEYFVAYLNELKRLNGMTDTVNSNSSDLIAYAVARAEENAARGLLTHQTDLDPADFNLLTTGGIDSIKPILSDENAATWTGISPYDPTLYSSTSSTPLSDQSIAYNLLLRWFTDYSNIARTATSSQRINYGHRIAELMASGPIGIGFSADGTQATLETVINYDFNNQDTSLFIPDFITNDMGETVMVRSGTNTPVVFLPAVTFNFVYNKDILGQETTQAVDTILESALSESQTNITSKQIALEEAKTVAEQASKSYVFALKNQANLTEKTAAKVAEISSLETSLQTAQTNLKNAKTKVGQIQEKLEQSSQNTQLFKLKEQLVDQEKAVQEAQTNLDIQKAELNKRQAELAEANKLIAMANQNLASARAKLETVRTNYQSLLTAQENLASAQEANQEARTKLAQSTADLENAKSKLSQLKKEATDAQLAYVDARANYDKLLLDYIIAKDLEDKSLENIITTLPDGTIIAIPKTSPSIAEKPSLGIEKLLESIKSSETNITGKTTPQIENNLGLNGNKESQQFKKNQANHVVKPNPSQSTKTQAVSQNNQTNHAVAIKLNQTANSQAVSINPRTKVANQTKELPNTGDTGSIAYALAGLSLLSTAVLIQKRKTKE